MADFFGGTIPIVAINPFNNGTTNIPGAVPNQNFGVGAATTAIGIGLNPAFGQTISNTSGFNLSNGQNFLATQIIPSVTAPLAKGIGDVVSNTLTALGPPGQLAEQFATGAVNTLTNTLFGTNAAGPNLAFPGAGGLGNALANFASGAAYTLGVGGPDVVISIQPANQGPQLFGQQALSDPNTATSLGFSQFTGEIPNYAGANFDTSSLAKLTAMDPAFSTSTSIGSNFAGGLGSTGQTVASYASGAVSSDLGLSSLGTTADYFSYFKPSTAESFANAEFGTEQIQSGAGEGWTFIVAPEDISWESMNAVDRVPIFGTNNPPVVSGTNGMRDMQLSNALVEGFTRNSTIEAKVLALENLTNYTLNNQAGFVNVPVYQVWANQKAYGDNGYFVIRDVRVKEAMRDLSGDSTRSYVDVSFMQVPEYQVDSGRDQASSAQAGAKSALPDQKAIDAASQAQATAAGNQGINPLNAGGANAPSPLNAGGQNFGATYSGSGSALSAAASGLGSITR